MKNSTGSRRLGRGIITLLTLFIVATLAIGQNLNIGAGGAFGGNGHYNIAGNITSVTPTSIPGTVTLDGAAQSISGGAITFNNLTIAGTDGKNASADITVQGQLTVNQNLNMNTNVLTMKDEAKSTPPTFAATTEVIGSMKWEAYSAQSYTFNNASTVVHFSGVDAARTFQLKVQPGTNPTGYQATTSVSRKINAAYSGWSTGTADIQLAYQNSEVIGGWDQSRLKGFHGTIGSGSKLAGTVSRTPSTPGAYGYVKYANLASTAFTSGDEIELDTRFNPFISIATAAWNSATTWDAGIVPSINDDVEISGAFAVTIPSGVSAAASSVLIDQGSSGGLTLNAGGSTTLSVGAGGLTNNNSNGAGLTLGSGTNVTVTGGTVTNAGAISNSGTIRVQ